jgi:glycosyltransferase involved in cell wall biosynthesis
MSKKIAVIIPCYKVTNHILKVINLIGLEVTKIYIIDDACPEKSGDYVVKNSKDLRLQVIYNQINLGVGGAVKRGYKAALEEDMDIIIKIDGDGQMDPRLIKYFIKPLLTKRADYSKGNRFYNIENLKNMPKIRMIGNAILSFVTKFSSGYWQIFDPTNGYTAINKTALKLLPLDKISNRYFFESDMLFRLNIINAVVNDVPMEAIYKDEQSNLHIKQVIGDFIIKNLSNFIKRIYYNYFLRNVSIGSVNLIFGLILFTFGIVRGTIDWLTSINTKIPASSGTVMVAALPIIIGFQLLLSFLQYDISTVPHQPLCLQDNEE